MRHWMDKRLVAVWLLVTACETGTGEFGLEGFHGTPEGIGNSASTFAGAPNGPATEAFQGEGAAGQAPGFQGTASPPSSGNGGPANFCEVEAQVRCGWTFSGCTSVKAKETPFTNVEECVELAVQDEVSPMGGCDVPDLKDYAKDVGVVYAWDASAAADCVSELVSLCGYIEDSEYDGILECLLEKRALVGLVPNGGRCDEAFECATFNLKEALRSSEYTQCVHCSGVGTCRRVFEDVDPCPVGY